MQRDRSREDAPRPRRVHGIQDIAVFPLFQIPIHPRIVSICHDLFPVGALLSYDPDKEVMPIATAQPQPLLGTEYTYRDRMLLVSRGSPLPAGATPTPNGINFVLLCRHGTAVWLILSEPCNGEIHAEIPLDPLLNRTGDHWHVRVDGLPEEFCYGYRVDGPKDNGHRYDPERILLDPYARALSCGRPWGAGKGLPRRSLMTESHAGTRAPDQSSHAAGRHDHLRTARPGLHRSTRARASAYPGTYLGLTEKIEDLKAPGDHGRRAAAGRRVRRERLSVRQSPDRRTPCGTSGDTTPIAFCAPKAAYAHQPDRGEPWQEFCRMVEAFHAAGIEVYLDVVFNHTAEGGDDGPTYNFRGVDNTLFYMLDERGRYLNYSGCGNTFSSDHPVVRNYLLDCLRNWVAEGGVDGFRFDLASVLGRDRHGNVLVEPPVIKRISEDSLLRDTKLIAEPWDAAGLYQVGTFPGEGRWSDWNGRFRDDVRRFWRGDPGMTSALATRICGSDDLYQGRGPLHSINFICCHDGFTLERPGLLQSQAQRGQRRGEPRRQRRQLELELRRRRADRRPGGPSTPTAAGAQPDGHPDDQPGRPHDPRRGRVPAHPAR